MCRWPSRLLPLAVLVCSPSASAQSAIEHHAWQDRGTFEPFSTTARAITGAISLSGNASLAEAGSTMRMTFAAGEPVDLLSEGAFWKEWSLGGGKQTAEVFRMASDPGVLLNGNTLCGDSARYVVFFEGDVPGGGSVLELAVFSGNKEPLDINSEGLCGTFSHALPASTVAFPSGASANDVFPSRLLGTWETHVAACGEQELAEGDHLRFFEQDDGELGLSVLNHATEGGSCRVTHISEVGTTLLLSASCRVEENAEEQTEYLINLAPSGTVLTAHSPWRVTSSATGTTYQKCQQPDAAPPAFVGIWDCGIGLFAFSSDSYLVGGNELRMKQIEQSENDFLLSFPDDYRLSLFDVTETALTWQSPMSGDTFPCVRR